jgi:hypothetical protein
MAARPAEIDYVPVPLPLASANTALPKSRTSRSSARREAYRAKATPQVAAPPQPLSSAQSMPLLVRNLLLLQRGSSVLLFVLGAITLGVYSQTVRAQRSWSDAYSQLALLRRQEPQLTLANESLKQHLADNAELEDSGLVKPDPFNALFLEPAAARPLRELPEAVEASSPEQEPPLSY